MARLVAGGTLRRHHHVRLQFTALSHLPSSQPATTPPQLGLPVGAAVPGAGGAPLSQSQKKRLKEHAKKAAEKEKEEAEAALAAAAAASSSGAAAAPAPAAADADDDLDPVKLKRKLEKKLRQVGELEAAAARGEALNEEQRAKVAHADVLRQQLAALKV
jgi:hypothetical protein